MDPYEAVLRHVSPFDLLRADEVAHVVSAFRFVRLAAGEAVELAGDDGPAMAVVVAGQARVEVVVAGRVARASMQTGDRYGLASLLTGRARQGRVVAREREAVVATIDAPSFDALLDRYPALALPTAGELARELRACDDAVRQALELHAERLGPGAMRAASDEWRASLAHRAARVTRLSPTALFRWLVARQGGEPPFWMLTGFALSLFSARLVVYLILKYHLEKQLFALVPGADPNPMHVHHFNYGLVLIAAAGLTAMLPFGRRVLRVLAFAFGCGCGLVFDEFALFWNLNPEYSQRLSIVASAVAATVLVQLTYFRRFWWALVRRGVSSVTGAR